MTVQEYAEEMNFTVQDVLNECKKLGIKVSSKDELLNDDDIVMLDNTMNLISANEELSIEENDAIDDVVENIMMGDELKTIANNPTTSKEKVRRRTQIEAPNNKDFLNKKKEMYKNKEKLTSNDDNNTGDVILYKEGMSLGDLAKELNITGAEAVKKVMDLGLLISVTQAVDYDTAELVVSEYNKELKKEETQDISNFENYEIVDDESNLVARPPVITIMGHVDHGKTTLLDYIRHSHVAEGEAGGITQSIGAYQINYNGNKLTFIDTPGHEAFTAMRARGAQITDIVIIIVSAEDGVMPQTKEAIDHAKSAGVPIVVAINKIDRPNAKPERVMEEMANEGLTPEEWGGDIPYLKISALTGEGVNNLLDTILAIAEVHNLEANPNRYAVGTVIESRIDKQMGGVASILIQNGTLRLGDPIVVGLIHGRVRTMKDDLGKEIVEAGPSTPVEITGLSGNPDAGDKFMAFESEKQARDIAEKRAKDAKSKVVINKPMSLDELFASIQNGVKEINVVLKCDVRGSEEAVKNSLQKIDVEGVKCKVIRSGIGTVTESDISLAQASNAIIIGFNVVPNNAIKEYAKQSNVELRLYTIIYKVVEEMEAAMKGMLDPEYEEVVTGNATVRQLFKFSKVGTIAGSYVTDGVIKSSSNMRVIRDGVIIYDGKIGSLQRGKEQVKEAKNGFECGITIDGYNDIKEGDILQAYENVEVKRK
ncbi:MAG TPA: translation initiation factor IF-2 [Bacilli bacterium]|jgi:translation initiation factor IF-2|nr:translation initiation factor IF-2 [Bacilli bacterium]HQC84099.1 translation initiation factor IF-2 [Bacilli bacterium]